MGNQCTIQSVVMPITKTVQDRLHEVVSLHVMPHSHQEVPSITGAAISKKTGPDFLYGHYSMDYELPGGDLLRIVANHNKSLAQLFLITHDPENLRHLPGPRASSLVANTISRLNRYLIRSNSYSKPRSKEQEAKYQITQKAIKSLYLLLNEESDIAVTEWDRQESLRTKVINILERCGDKNRLIANNPVVSEGELGIILYDTKQEVQHFQFNRVFPVSKLDQLDFSEAASERRIKKPCFVWDSEIHIGSDELALDDTLRVICQTYGLESGNKLTDIAANRFERFGRFLQKMWKDTMELVEYLALPKKPEHSHKTTTLAQGLSMTQIKPYYVFQGFEQTKYRSLQNMVNHCTGTYHLGFQATSLEQAKNRLATEADGCWAMIAGENLIILRKNNQLISLRYGEYQGWFFPLPNGDDLRKISHLTKKHLFLPEKIRLGLRAFISRIPSFFNSLYSNLKTYITQDLPREFKDYIDSNHPKPSDVIPQETTQANNTAELSDRPSTPNLDALQDILIQNNLMEMGQSLEDFIRQRINDSHYIIVREQHPPSPPAYNNPLHRSLDLLRHFADYFVDTSEKNPMIGTLAMAAYFYGAGAIIAPKMLTALLTKLHLKGLICGIQPTQDFGKWMSNGTMSEAISAAVSYWQGVVIAGDLDNFFMQAVTVLRDDPAEVAIVVALAITLGYGLCQAIPPLQEEMGRFPYINYAALGAKGGAAVYDTVMHPGDDWLLGTIKWLLRGGLTLVKLLVGPFVEGWYYGFRENFLPAWQKSRRLFLQSVKQSLAALADLSLIIASIPFLEVSAMFLHVPFRGITNFISRSLGLIGQWRPVGRVLLAFANRSESMNHLVEFDSSPLYEFTNPIQRYADNRFLNGLILLVMVPCRPIFQLVKNLVILPVFDVLNFSIRALLMILDPLSRLLAFCFGHALVLSGFVWDNTVGRLFKAAAEGVTLSSNWLDNQAGAMKQRCLEEIQILRRQIHHWAFAEDDRKSHHINTDQDYFHEKPMRLEKLPHEHDSTHCLLATLLNKHQRNKTESAQDLSSFHSWLHVEDPDQDDDLLITNQYHL
jgi:hypothetical protein